MFNARLKKFVVLGHTVAHKDWANRVAKSGHESKKNSLKEGTGFYLHAAIHTPTTRRLIPRISWGVITSYIPNHTRVAVKAGVAPRRRPVMPTPTVR